LFFCPIPINPFLVNLQGLLDSFGLLFARSRLCVHISYLSLEGHRHTQAGFVYTSR